jgi:LPXTG-motif cell wall-anchored protein
MKKLILAFATVAFIGFGSSTASAQFPPTTIPGSGDTPPACKEWDGISPIPEVCEDFYIEQIVVPPVPTTTTTVPVTIPPGDLPRTGSGVSPILGIGALLLVGGGIVVVASRRRTGSAAA